MWAVYMVMVFTRWNSGWRGRRAAFLATFAFVAALAAWAANYFSAIHRFADLMRFQLIGVNHKSAPLEVRERLAIPSRGCPIPAASLPPIPESKRAW